MGVFVPSGQEMVPIARRLRLWPRRQSSGFGLSVDSRGTRLRPCCRRTDEKRVMGAARSDARRFGKVGSEGFAADRR